MDRDGDKWCIRPVTREVDGGQEIVFGSLIDIVCQAISVSVNGDKQTD